MAGHIILTLIIGCFIIVALRYFYFNSLRTGQHRDRSFLAALKCIYWLPVFSQAIVVVYCMIIGLYYFVLRLTSQLIDTSIIDGLLQNATLFNYFFVLCTAVFSIAVLGWLARISSNRQLDLQSAMVKLVYFLVAILTTAVLRRLLAFCVVGSHASFGIIWWIIILLGILVFGLLKSHTTHRYRLLRYLQLASRISSSYGICCMAFALVFYFAWLVMTWMF